MALYEAMLRHQERTGHLCWACVALLAQLSKGYLQGLPSLAAEGARGFKLGRSVTTELIQTGTQMAHLGSGREL